MNKIPILRTPLLIIPILFCSFGAVAQMGQPKGKVTDRDSLKTDSVTLDEVVVTGVGRATLIRENPVAIQHVSTKTIEQTTQSNIIDVLVQHIPGLNAVKTGPNISKPFIRGLGYNRVLTLFDGIRQEGQQWGDEHGLEVDAYHIARAEVIKGPSSIMYGSDALAGVVSLFSPISTDRDGKLHGKYSSECQTNNGLIGNGLLLTYADEHWSYALRGSYRLAKNYTNPIDGRVYNSNFRETNVSATAQHNSTTGYSNFNVTYYNNLQGIPDGSRDSLTRQFTKQVYEGEDDDLSNRPIVSQNELNSYRLSPLHQHIRHYRLYSNNHYTLGEGDVDFSLAYQQNSRIEYNHPTAPEQAGMYVQLQTANYAFRYNAPEIANTEISLGVNGMYQDNQSKDATDFPIPDYHLFDAGTYVFAKWKKEDWTISGGLRYDIRHLKGDDFYTGAYLQFPAFNKTYKGLSLSIGSAYQVNDYLTVKANIARGYRAPNITEFASNGLDPGAHIVYLGNRNFEPEFSLQEDLGIDLHTSDVAALISIFNNNIAHYIYLSQLSDARGNPIVDPQGNKTYQYQQSSAQLYGLEATFDLHPSAWKGLSFDNSLSVIYGFNRDKQFKGTGINGSYLPLIPPVKWLSSLNQHFSTRSPLVPGLDAKFEMEYNAAQNRYLALYNTETATPGYVLFNVGVNATLHHGKGKDILLQFQVNNLLDKAYQSNLSRLKYFEYYSSSPNGNSGIFNMGRNIGFKAIVPF